MENTEQEGRKIRKHKFKGKHNLKNNKASSNIIEYNYNLFFISYLFILGLIWNIKMQNVKSMRSEQTRNPNHGKRSQTQGGGSQVNVDTNEERDGPRILECDKSGQKRTIFSYLKVHDSISNEEAQYPNKRLRNSSDYNSEDENDQLIMEKRKCLKYSNDYDGEDDNTDMNSCGIFIDEVQESIVNDLVSKSFESELIKAIKSHKEKRRGPIDVDDLVKFIYGLKSQGINILEMYMQGTSWIEKVISSINLKGIFDFYSIYVSNKYSKQ